MNIAVYIETHAGDVRATSLEALGLARTLVPDATSKVVAVLVGANLGAAAAVVAAAGADTVALAEEPRLSAFAPGAHHRALVHIARAHSAGLVLVPATSRGRDLAARTAASFDTSCVADCTGVKREGATLVFTRPMYSGKVVAEVVADGPVVVASLRPRAFARPTSPTAGTVEPTAVPFEDADFRAVVTERIALATSRPALAEAAIVVSGGRGLKGGCDPEDKPGIAKNFALLESLADSLDAAVGASRAVVDAGWRPHEEQVGQTGKTVSPTLYVAVGISGAIQHLAGMRGAKHVIAINKEPTAPIFAHADLGIVGDLFEVLPALEQAIRAAKG